MKVICYTSSTLWKRKNKKVKKRKAWETMLLSWKKGGPTKSVESRIHYVNQKEWNKYVAPHFFIKEAIRRIHPLCLCRRHTDLPFEVKAPTYIRSGCTDLRAPSSHRPWAEGSSLYVGTKESIRRWPAAFLPKTFLILSHSSTLKSPACLLCTDHERSS